MLLSRAYHQLSFDAAKAPEGGRVCYVLLPAGQLEDIRKWAERAAAAHGCSIVLVSGMDWNRDMTPWPADGVMKDRKKFSGGAVLFLKELLEDHIPSVEQWLKISSPKRYLIGISLSGLFAVWALSRTASFAGIGSVSGSLWYDGLADWARTAQFNCGTSLYLSLGVKEKNTPDKRMATVEDATKDVASILEGKGVSVDFEMVPGTHFSPAAPKFDRALAALLGAAQTI